MSNHIGSSTIYTSILPTGTNLRSVKLSKSDKQRLRVVEYYHKTGNASLTCRHFGICRSYLYKWLKRYNPKYLPSLESRSTQPKNVRQATYNTAFVTLVRKLRTDYPSFSAKKLAGIVFRDHGYTYSAATIGRIIKRFALYFRAKVLASKQRAKQRAQAWKRRKPYGLKATGPRRIVEFDMKHIFLGGVKQYAFVAVDIFSKQIAIHLAMQPSSWQAQQALQKVLELFGRDVVIVNDNGSENLKHAYEYLKNQDITQYFARPHTPKDKPHVENVIGKLQQECLDEYRGHYTLAERDTQVTAWVNDYHYYRPHQALGYLTPDEFCATMGLTIPRVEVSTM